MLVEGFLHTMSWFSCNVSAEKDGPCAVACFICFKVWVPGHVEHGVWGVFVNTPSGFIRFEVCVLGHVGRASCLCEFFLPPLLPLELMGATRRASFTIGWGYLPWLLGQVFLPIVVGFYIAHACVCVYKIWAWPKAKNGKAPCAPVGNTCEGSWRSRYDRLVHH